MDEWCYLTLIMSMFFEDSHGMYLLTLFRIIIGSFFLEFLLSVFTKFSLFLIPRGSVLSVVSLTLSSGHDLSTLYFLICHNNAKSSFSLFYAFFLIQYNSYFCISLCPQIFISILMRICFFMMMAYVSLSL